jgi:hypothetical protein
MPGTRRVGFGQYRAPTADGDSDGTGVPLCAQLTTLLTRMLRAAEESGLGCIWSDQRAAAHRMRPAGMRVPDHRH